MNLIHKRLAVVKYHCVSAVMEMQSLRRNTYCSSTGFTVLKYSRGPHTCTQHPVKVIFNEGKTILLGKALVTEESICVAVMVYPLHYCIGVHYTTATQHNCQKNQAPTRTYKFNLDIINPKYKATDAGLNVHCCNLKPLHFSTQKHRAQPFAINSFILLHVLS